MLIHHPRRSRQIAIQAREALDSGNVRRALELYDELVLSEPDEARWRRRRLEAIAVAVRATPDPERRFDEAMRRLREAVEESPEDAMAHFELAYGTLVLSLGDSCGVDQLQAARAGFDRSRSLAPTNLGGWWGLVAVADIERFMGKASTDLAVQLAHSAIHEVPNDSRTWILLATTLVSAHGLSDARKVLSTLDRALNLDADNIEGWALRGDVLCKLGDVQSAIECYHHVIDLEPTSWLAMSAKACIERIVKSGPDDAGSASGVPIRVATIDPDKPPPSPGSRMPIPQWIPAFRTWPLASNTSACRVILFETAW